MKFSEFWHLLLMGGKSRKSYTYRINNSDQLIIASPRSLNQCFKINKTTVEKYFSCLTNQLMTAEQFKYRHSAWFFDVYDTLVPNTDVSQIPSLFSSNAKAVQLAVQIINIFKELGFQTHRPKWPKIILADDPPEEEKCRFDGFPERIDGVCGLYCDSTQTITLFCNPIAATANSIRVPFSVAMAVVLAHELTHWITYRFSHPKSKPNKTAFKRYGLGQVDFEGKSVTEVVEGIAELATFCAIRKTKDDCLRKEMLHYFKKMHEKLCSDYRAFDIYFEFWPLEYVVSHLVRLARRNDPSASTLKSNKNPDDSPYFEYHWHGCFEYENSKASPWTLSYSEGPAVLINLYPFDKGFPNQMKHDESGWYNWPSAAIFSKPNHSIYGRPNEMNLHRVFLEFGNLKSPSSGGPAMVYISHLRPYLRFSEWEPDNQHGVRRVYT